MVMCKLRMKDTKTTFVVAATHLKAKPSFEEDRKEETLVLLDEIGSFSQHKLPCFVLGDFNDIPDSLCYNAMIKAGYFSAYTLYENKIEPFTTSKIRETLTHRTIDYIFFLNSNCNVCTPYELLSPIDEAFLGETHLPLPNYPSDHLALAASFEIN